MSAGVRERVLPWLLVLPALLFATPLSPLADDPYPHLAGAGWAALLSIPLAALVLARGGALRGAWPFVLALAWAVLARALAPVTDTFEARRALVVLALAPLAFAGGAALDERGRARFEALLVLLACVWTGFALWSGFVDANFAGVLGDTGSLSQAALPGAAIGSAWLVHSRESKRLVGGLAVALFLVHAAAAPVLAGGHTLLAGLLGAACAGRSRGRAGFAALALVALLSPFAGMAVRQGAGSTSPAPIEGAQAQPSRSLGGLGVRALVWRASLGLIGAHPLLGAGPGQFQAAFPPHRDPREIELSRHGVCSELDTEVEHAHNDWLQGFCELGLVGGGFFALGLALAVRTAFRGLRREERVPAALAALALLVNAFVHAPLSGNPAASMLAFALFGTLAVEPDGTRAPSRPAGAVVALPAFAAVFFAPALVRHGLALCDSVAALRGLSRVLHDEDGRFWSANHAAIVRARAVAPASAPARIAAAREAGSPDFWDRVLEVRPSTVEAWEQSGTQHARAGRYEEAHRRYERALALSPTHPRILRNSARLELTQGDPARGMEAVERLRAQGCFAEEWLESIGNELVLVLGRPGRAAPILFGQPLERLSPEELHARAETGTSDSPDPALRAWFARHGAAAAECLAQLLWARDHAARGSFEVALRNYRQAAEQSHAGRGTASGPAPLYALELAAAEARAGRAEAPEHARGVALDAAAWAELPDWARETLVGLGLAPTE